MNLLNKEGKGFISGRIAGDVKFSKVGEKKYSRCSFGVITGKDEDIINVICWFELANVAKNFNKNDNVFCVINDRTEREYNGKVYVDHVADFVAKAGSISTPTPKAQAPADAKLEPIKDEDMDDLPF